MLEKTLYNYFGFKNFRPGQEEIVNAIVSKRDVLAVLPTGGGKSLCYQLPAFLFSGFTVVISPLISLMKDQVDQLNEIGISAKYINSTLDTDTYIKTLSRVRNNEIKLLYIAPERLEVASFVDEISKLDVSIVAIDEAHCISQWGHDFRPSYRRIKTFIDKFSNRPIVAAFTATATDLVRKDIANQLELINPFIKINSFDRPNIKFVIKEPTNKLNQILEDINKDDSIIIYANTRKKVDELKDFLEVNGYKVSKYHAGMTKEEREKSQDGFIKDRINIIVATNAFGMGIDKPDVRRVIHYNMPKDIESYYQEAGRAGRDGDMAEAILYFSPADIVGARYLIDMGNDPNAVSKLNDMVSYTNEASCLRAFILNYFGEGYNKKCGNCSACLDEVEKVDITIEAQKILSCVYRMDQKFGMDLVSKVLKGSRDKKVLKWRFDKISTYGILSDLSISAIKNIISLLLTKNYLSLDQYSALKLNRKSKEILQNSEKVFMRKKRENVVKIKNNTFDNEEIIYPDLYRLLSEKRYELAQNKNVPPYIIFSNASLRDMANKLPTSLEEFLTIDGVGQVKLENYGNIFISVIKEFVIENDIILKNIYINQVIKSKSVKDDTVLISYKYFTEDGLTVEEIAAKRGYVKSTIMNHLSKAIERGYKLDFVSNLDEEIKEEILEAVMEVGTKSLKSIKEIVCDDISYENISEYLLEYRCMDSKPKLSKEWRNYWAFLEYLSKVSIYKI